MLEPTTKELIDPSSAFLQSYAQSKGGKIKVFVDKEGTLDTYAGKPIDSLEISDSAYLFIVDSISSLNQQINLDISVTTEKAESDIKVFKHSFDVSGAGESSGLTKLSYSYSGSAKTPENVSFEYIDISVNTIFGDDKTNFWKYVFLHELGHALGLEHPFDLLDGDGIGDKSNPTIDETLMAYGPPTNNAYPTQYKDVDIQALQEIWGEGSKGEGGSAGTDSALQVLVKNNMEETINWSSTPLDNVSEETYQDINWSKVNLQELFKNKSAIVWPWVQFNELTAKQYKAINWKKVEINGFTEQNYGDIDWSLVNFKRLLKHHDQSLKWSQVEFEEAFASSAHKKINWSKVNFDSFSDASYSSINWSKVSFSGKKSVAKSSSLDWSKVEMYQIFSTNAYKKVDWSKINFTNFSDSEYAKINWSKVRYTGQKAITQAKQFDWNNVNLSQVFNSKAHKSIDWSEVDFKQLDSEKYNEVDWGNINFSGKKGIDYTLADWNAIISSTSFSKKAASKINWLKVDASALNDNTLSILQSDQFSSKNKVLGAFLQGALTAYGNETKALSFAGTSNFLANTANPDNEITLWQKGNLSCCEEIFSPNAINGVPQKI